LLALNADNNMPYDICEEPDTLQYVESVMAKNGKWYLFNEQTNTAFDFVCRLSLKPWFVSFFDSVLF